MSIKFGSLRKLFVYIRHYETKSIVFVSRDQVQMKMIYFLHRNLAV